MTPEQIELVERSFAKIGPVTEATGLAFYRALFEIDPEARDMFGNDIDGQARKLMQVLAYAVSNLRSPETLLPLVHDLGRRHAGYGVEDAHYDSVAKALLSTLAKALGPDWTEATADAWAATYDLISTEMRDGARALAPA